MFFYFSITNLFPYSWRKKLFGDRQKYGYQIIENDSCWLEWKKRYHDFYLNTQKKGVGKIVNDAGYKILKNINLSELSILEIGPGGFFHSTYWKGKPKKFTIVDVDEKFLDISEKKLIKLEVPFEKKIISRSAIKALPFDSGEFDLIISFYSLEHLHPLSIYMDELLRVLKPSGRIVGAIPTEGGLFWGWGRYFTSRKWLLKNTKINPDKIICWEHPNFASEILRLMNDKMKRKKLIFWPSIIKLVDFNFVIKFIYQKP
jgi:SAM-dependent methyltransferase